MGKSKKYFYAVSSGRQPGIYTCWGQAEEQVNRFKGSVYKGYATLHEALQDMRVNGYSDPPIFEHQNVQIEYSHSDLNLSLPVLQVNQSNVENQPVMSSSETQLKTYASPTTYNECTMNDYMISKQSHELDTEPSTAIEDNNDIFYDSEICFQNIDDQAIDNEKKINTVLNTEKTPLNGLSEVNFTENNSTPLLHKINNDCSCTTELRELKQLIIEMKNDYKTQTQLLLTELREENANLKNQVVTLQNQHEKLANELFKHKDMMDQNSKNQERLLRNNLEQIEEVNKDVCEQKLLLLKSMEQSKSQIESKKSNIDQQPGQQIQSSRNESILYDTRPAKENLSNSERKMQQPIKDLNVSQTKSTSRIDYDDVSTDAYIRYHPASKKFNLSNNAVDSTYVQKNSIHVSSNCTNLLLGDSNMKNVVRKKLDRTGQTEVRTYRGASIRTLNDIIDKSTRVFPQVKKVALCIGTNDCSRSTIHEEQIHSDMDKLISTVKEVFPNAMVTLLAIPPTRNPTANRFIGRINSQLKKQAKDLNILYKSCDALWYHVGKAGDIDDGILVDMVHLSEWGLGLLLQNVVSFFFREKVSSQKYESQPFNSTEGYVKNSPAIPTTINTSPTDNTTSNTSEKPAKQKINEKNIMEHVSKFLTKLILETTSE